MLWEEVCSSKRSAAGSQEKSWQGRLQLYLRALYAFDTCHPVSFAPRSGIVDVKLLGQIGRLRQR